MNYLNGKNISNGYALLMVTVYLLAFGPGGYRRICEAKWAALCILTGLYALCLAIAALRSRERRRPGLSLSGFCMAAYFLLTLLGALCSEWRVSALLGDGRDDGALAALIYVFAALALSLNARPEKPLLHAMAAALLLYCAVCFMQLLDGNPLGLFPGELRWSGREVRYNGAFLGFTGNADMSAAVLAMGFCACLSGAFAAKERWLLLPALAAGAVLGLSGMRGGLLGAVGGTLLTLPCSLRLQRSGRRVYWLGLASAALLSLVLVWLLPLPGMLGELHAILHGELSDSFGTGRIYIWRNVLPLLGERPLLGGGADTLGLRAGLAFTKQTADGGLLSRGIDCAHCEYLNVAVNQGLPALACLLLGAGRSLVRSGSGHSAAASVLRSALAAYGVQALTGITMPGSTAYFWLCWGLLEAALRGEENENREGQE